MSAELSKTKAGIMAQLCNAKMRRKHGLFAVEGEKCVKDTLGAFPVKWIAATPEWLERNQSFITKNPGDYYAVDSRKMGAVSSLTTPPEVIAVMELPALGQDFAKPSPEELHLFLDGIQDPGNLGTILRTADWFGFHTVYASKTTADVFNPKTIQSTMGALKRVNVVYTDLPLLIRESGIRNIYGLMLDGTDINKSDLSGPGAIVMGNEGNGLSEELRALVTRKLLIPPYDTYMHPESLNVAVATGITLSYFRK